LEIDLNALIRKIKKNPTFKGLVQFLKKLILLIIYSPPCHPRCPWTTMCGHIFFRVILFVEWTKWLEKRWEKRTTTFSMG